MTKVFQMVHKRAIHFSEGLSAVSELRDIHYVWCNVTGYRSCAEQVHAGSSRRFQIIQLETVGIQFWRENEIIPQFPYRPLEATVGRGYLLKLALKEPYLHVRTLGVATVTNSTTTQPEFRPFEYPGCLSPLAQLRAMSINLAPIVLRVYMHQGPFLYHAILRQYIHRFLKESVPQISLIHKHKFDADGNQNVHQS
ncbi:hypothetical protein BJV74DRAFT_28337 [Russula compacta]|nr:hypothetical protein BJV74DRAFT_28337 [Russula compacta]